MELQVSCIDLDPALQVRKEMNRDTIKNYEKAYRNGVKLPPLLIAERIGATPLENMYVILNGFHRFVALKNIRQESVTARVVTVDQHVSLHHLRWLGGRENLKNGLPLKAKDTRELFRAYVKAKQHKIGNTYKSYRKIAEEMAFVTHQTIANWMQSDFPSVYRAMGRNTEGVDNRASGTGQTYVHLPELTFREFDLAIDDLLRVAKDGNNDTRWLIQEHLAGVQCELTRVAPCIPPEF